MVYIVDLDDEACEPPDSATLRHHEPPSPAAPTPTLDQDDVDEGYSDHVYLLAAALGCYPIISQIASHLDLNSLHDLALTCRAFRNSLLQSRNQLVKQTLRCSNDRVPMGPRLAMRLRQHHDAIKQNGGRAGAGTLTSGRVALCARDMVGECRRCGTVVCRNCTVKPQPPKALRDRHRRLCKTCIKAPLMHHTAAPLGDAFGTVVEHAFAREPCTCSEKLYLCTCCGNAIRTADTTYTRGWSWRNRYSTYLGGLGTGIGEGNEGVECGKGAACLAARELEKEIDCTVDEIALIKQEEQQVESPTREWGGTSYLTQEIEGIGGSMKKKVKKRVRVGAVVKEYEEERNDGKYLAREHSGISRSWCSWCSRVIPSSKDAQLADGNPLARQLSCGASSSSSSVDVSSSP